MTEVPTLPSRLRQAEGLRSAVLDGETVLYDPAHDRLHLLDTSATAVWSRLDGRGLDEVVADLAEAFGMAPEDMVQDVRGVLVTLREAELLQP